MKIVWIANVSIYGLGGAEAALLESVRGLVQRGVDIHVVLPFSERGDLVNLLESMGASVSVIYYTFWRGGPISYSSTTRLSTLRSIRGSSKVFLNYLRQIRPDLVVTNTLTASPSAAFASRWLNIPHIWYIHEFASEDHGMRFFLGDSVSLFLINKFSKRVIVNSRAVRDEFQNWVPQDKLRLVYYAMVPPTQSKEIKEENNTFRVILVGHMHPGKRQEDAIRAVSLLSKKGFDVRLCLAGDESPEYGSYLRNLARELEVGERIDFVGFAGNPHSYVASSDVALMCSKSEAFGRVTVEAMQLGKPVVGANHGGTTELIQDGWNGLLYQVEDAEDLARKIEILYRDRELTEKMGRNAQEWSNRTFTMEKHISSLLSVFEEVVRPEAGKWFKKSVGILL